jgi:hypothetical protein
MAFGSRTACGAGPFPFLLAGALLVGALAACGDESSGTNSAPAGSQSSRASEVPAGVRSEEVGSERSGTPETVDCPADATAIDLPEELQALLPEGTKVVSVQGRDGGRTVLTGVIPAAEPDVLAMLEEDYAAAGLTLTEGATEERDAAANFTGAGLTGRWGIRALEDCSAPATRIDLVVRPS